MSDSPPASLLNMPEHVMSKVMEDFEYIDIQRLRKTCYTLRHIINIIKPKAHLTNIDISSSAENLSLKLYRRPKNLRYVLGIPKPRIDYRKENNTTKVTWNRDMRNRERILDDANFLDVFSQDFGSLLGCNLPVFSKISINCERNGLKAIRKCLESSGSMPLKVKFLTISNATCQEDVMDILQFICPITLEHLNISCFKDDPDEAVFARELARGEYKTWDISKIMELEHWKKVERIDMRRIQVQAGIQNIERFEKAQFCFEQLTVQDVLRLKENFLHTTSHSKSLLLWFQRFPGRDVLNERFGQPHEMRSQLYFFTFPFKSWFFRRPDNSVLYIEIAENFFIFTIKNNITLPEQGWVID